jgi:hypothetical protein
MIAKKSIENIDRSETAVNAGRERQLFSEPDELYGL